MQRLSVLHLSADFPDPLSPGKTRAVAGLLELVPQHDHWVYALNRVRRSGTIAALPFGPERGDGPAHRAITYPGLPFGMRMAHALSRLSRWIIADLEARGLRPNLVHAHKLSVEGLVAEPVARHFGVPLIVSCQGNSDIKILSAKPGLRADWRRIWHGAAHVLPFAPWTASALSDLLGTRTGPLDMFPCPTLADQIIVPRETGPMVRTAFRLDEHRNKQVATLVRACALAARCIPDLRLEIAGTGSPKAFAHLDALIRPYGSIARLTGPIAHGDMQAFWNGAACMAMPSRRESYGMVYAEALLSGCPVIHAHGAGIDGYFPDALFAQPVPVGDAETLARRITYAIRSQSLVKMLLAHAQERGDLDHLRRAAIADLYRAVLEQSAAAMATSGQAKAPAAGDKAGRAA